VVDNSRPGQAIYDPFLGSGTSLIAAEMDCLLVVDDGERARPVTRD
jgi:DNA modification methylase